MSLSGSLFSAVSGLKAQAQGMGIISDNIANANTVGYKGSKAQFETLVTAGATRTTYSPGGVLPRPGMLVDRQGLINASASSTDIAIQGRGFFAVTDASNVAANGSVSSTAQRAFTRAGSFSMNKDGILVNSAGFALLGVPTNTTGVPTTTNPSVLGLQPVTVGGITGSASPTTEIKLGANLPAVTNAPSKLSIAGTVASGTATLLAPQISTAVVYSSSGAAYEAQIQIDRAATANAPYVVTLNGLTPLNGAPATTTVLPAVLGNITVPTNGTASSFVAAAPIAFPDGSTFTANIDASRLRSGTQVIPLGRFEVDAQQVTTTVYDSLGVAHNLTLEFARDQVAAAGVVTPGTLRNWTVKILDMRVASTNAVSVTFPLAGLGTRFPVYLDGSNADNADVPGGAPVSSRLSFNADGTLSASAPNALPLMQLVSGANAFGGGGLTLNLGTPGQKSGLTSQSDQFDVSFIQQNGIPYGTRSGVEIDEEGLVRVVFTNGQSIPVYKLPVVTFADPNQLEAASGNIFFESIASGTALPNYAGRGGSGTITPASLEASTVDISEEFTNMIVTQRSYSANARTITTADEMLQEVLNVKR